MKIRSHVNEYMEWWNAKSDLAWDRVRNAGRLAYGPIKMMGGTYDPLGIFEGIGMAPSASDNSNLKLAALFLFVMTRNTDDALKILAVEKGAIFGSSTSNNYKATFFNTNPELKGSVVVHQRRRSGMELQ